MLNIYRHRRITLYPLFSLLSNHFCTKTSNSHSFAISYFINNLGFSPESASKLCSTHNVRFKTSKIPNSALTFFRNQGFSDSQLHNMIPKVPGLISCDPSKRILPKFQFFLSKEIGMKHTCIAMMLRCRGSVFRVQECVMLKAVEELKDLGFNPSKSTFATALLAKAAISKTLWKEKVDTFMKWGWSDEDILKAFRKDPHCMLHSVDKINSVMSFWVNQLGLDALVLVHKSFVFAYSLERNIIPRATILQFLVNEGLREKDASLTAPFKIPEKLFIVNYIKRFKDHSSDLLKLYEEKQNAACTTRENNGMS